MLKFHNMSIAAMKRSFLFFLLFCSFVIPNVGKQYLQSFEYTLGPGKTFEKTVKMHPYDEFFRVEVNDTRLNATVIKNEMIWQWKEIKTAGSLIFYMTPNKTGTHCDISDINASGICSFEIQLISNLQHGPLPFKIETLSGKILQFNVKEKSSVMRLREQNFGIEIGNSDLPVQIVLTPDPSKKNVDLDLYLYNESKFLFYPNMYHPNLLGNEPESFVIDRSASYFSPGLYTIRIYASKDTVFVDNQFFIEAYRNYVPPEENRWWIIIAICIGAGLVC